MPSTLTVIDMNEEQDEAAEAGHSAVVTMHPHAERSQQGFWHHGVRGTARRVR